MTIDYALGIDGGGSKTVLVLVNRAGDIVSRTRTGGTNPLDNPSWKTVLDAALAPFADYRDRIAIGAGMPAHGEVREISALQIAALAEHFGPAPQSVLNDVDVAQIGAFAGEAGILILSGTGSMAWARDGAGRSSRVGGWGDVIGDEGSSYWIGKRLLAVVSKSIDGRGPATGLSDALLTHLHLDRADPANAIIGWVSGLSHARSEIAALAPLATRLAESGDATAIALIDDAAHELALHITTIARRIGADLPWSYAGGTFQSALLVNRVAAIIGRPPVAPRLPPIGGAVLEAMRRAGWPIDDAAITRLNASLS